MLDTARLEPKNLRYLTLQYIRQAITAASESPTRLRIRSPHEVAVRLCGRVLCYNLRWLGNSLDAALAVTSAPRIAKAVIAA
jgi:hypothetical protein